MILTSLFLIFLDKLILVPFQKHKIISNISNSFLNYFIWISTSILFILFDTSIGYIILVDIDGSGIPEMKALLSCNLIYKYFSFKDFILKSLGILISDVSISKVTPYIHLSILFALL